jgi:N-acetylmuramoyl-L-alanine amidase
MKSLLICAILWALPAFAVTENPFKVIIDPGHGGTDSGATLGELKEATLTLQISKKLESLLQKDQDFKPIMTRGQDRLITLGQRCRTASQFHGNLFISIHINSSPDPHAHGSEIYFQSQMPADEETLFLANRENTEITSLENDPEILEKKGDLAVIVDDIKKTQNVYASQIFAETFAQTWRSMREQPIRQGPFQVLMSVPMPSVLIEVGFITNPEEQKKLKNPQYQNQVAAAIYKSIKKFKEKIDKSEFSSHIIKHAT